MDVRDAVVHEDVGEFAEGMLRTLSNAASRAGVTVVGEQLRVFDGEVSPPGFAMAILLDESHISLHAYSDLGLMAFDCFTCGNKAATTDIANRFTALVAEQFEHATLRQSTVDRFPYDAPADGGEEGAVAGSGERVAAASHAAAEPGSGLPVSLLLDVSGVLPSSGRNQVELLQGASSAVRHALGRRGSTLSEAETSIAPGGGSLSCVYDGGHATLRIWREEAAILLDVTAFCADLADTVASALEHYFVDAHPGTSVQRHRVGRLSEGRPSG